MLFIFITYANYSVLFCICNIFKKFLSFYAKYVVLYNINGTYEVIFRVFLCLTQKK